MAIGADMDFYAWLEMSSRSAKSCRLSSSQERRDFVAKEAFNGSPGIYFKKSMARSFSALFLVGFSFLIGLLYAALILILVPVAAMIRRRRSMEILMVAPFLTADTLDRETPDLSTISLTDIWLASMDFTAMLEISALYSIRAMSLSLRSSNFPIGETCFFAGRLVDFLDIILSPNISQKSAKSLQRGIDLFLRGLLRLFYEGMKDNESFLRKTQVENPIGISRQSYTYFKHTFSNRRHGPNIGHAHKFPSLQSKQSGTEFPTNRDGPVFNNLSNRFVYFNFDPVSYQQNR